MSGGGLCYGYNVVRGQDVDGGPIAGGRTINQPEAEVIRRVFTDFMHGRSPAPSRSP